MSGRVRRRRIHAPFEATAGLRAQLVPAGRPGDGHRVEVRGLHHDRGGVRADLGAGPAHHPGQSDGTGTVGDEQVVGAQVADHVVQGGQLLPRLCATDHDRPVQPVRVVRVDRLPGLQHHVVGEVDGQRDRAHPGQLHPAGQPARTRPGRVDTGHRDRDEERAGLGLRTHRVAVRHGSRRVERHRITERHPGGLGRLAGETTQRQAVAAVRGDGDVQHLFPQLQHRCRVVAGGRVVATSRRQDHDPVVLVAQPELTGGADHPVGDVPVRLPRRDREPTGQHRTGQRDDDQVTDGEVVRAADDPARSRHVVAGRIVVLRAHVDPAPADHLAVLLRLVDVGQHSTNHQRTGDVGSGLLDRLDLQTGPDQVLGQAAPVEILGQGRVVPQPAQRRPHRAASIDDALIGRVPAVNGCSARLPRSCRACPRRRYGTSGCGRRPSRRRSPSRRSSPPRRPPAPAG